MKIMKTSGNGDWTDDSESDGREGVRIYDRMDSDGENGGSNDYVNTKQK